MITEDLPDALDSALAFTLANLHTNIVCKVTAVGQKTISCKPVVNRVVRGQSIELPVFTEVPPIFMHGGSSYEAFPIAVDDYCILFISERCFDAWYVGNDFVSPLDMRMHDYSDGFALVGIQNQEGAIDIPTLITKIGDMYAQGNWEHIGNLIREGDEVVTGNREQTGNTVQDGNVTVTGQVNAGSFRSGSAAGQSGTFIDNTGKVITVTNGIITGGL